MENEHKEKYENSTLIRASYGAREMFGQWIGAAFGFTVFYFYETVIGLNTVLTTSAYIIWNVWNAVNDPLIGYLVEHHHFFWEKKKGFRHMPFILIGGISWLVLYAAIFFVPLEWHPVGDQWLIFGYYVSILVVYDVASTLFEVNVLAVFPEKFRGLNERRSVTGFGTILGNIGLVLAAIIPPMFYNKAVTSSFRDAGLVTLYIGLLIFVFIIPGTFENKRMRDMYKRQRELSVEQPKKQGFFSTAKVVLTNRQFVSKIILFFGYQVAVVMLQTSALYVSTFILDADESFVTILFGSILIGALASAPVWLFVSKKANNNRKLSLIGGFVMAATFIPMIFVTTPIEWVIALLAFGISLGGQWFMDPPTMGDVLDDVAVKKGKRDPGVYYGYQSLVIKLGQTSVALVIGLVHILTGFPTNVPNLDLAKLLALSPTPDLALFGIRIHAVIIPAIIVFVATLLFWKYYELTPEKVMANKAKLKELGI